MYLFVYAGQEISGVWEPSIPLTRRTIGIVNRLPDWWMVYRVDFKFSI